MFNPINLISEYSVRKFFLFFVLYLTTSVVHAQWYEAKGHAYITQDGKHIARTQAIESALKKALLVAGASVSSVQQVVNGLLTQDDISIRASGSVNSFELLEETHEKNKISVTIRADIFPEDKKCFSADYRKSLLLTRSHFINREQANIGSLYQLDRDIIKKLAHKIKTQGRYLDTVLSLKHTTHFSRYNDTLKSDAIKNMSMSLADRTNTQFILFSEIQDISLQNVEQSDWLFWKNKEVNRQFTLQVYIYNGNNGEQLFNKQYHKSAIWPFNKRDDIDTLSAKFWESSYGNIVGYTLDNVLNDIDESMMCQSTRGKILHIENGVVTINLGRKNGVQVGDEFSLLHLNNFITDKGKTYAGYNVSDFTVKVTQISENTLRAKPISQAMLDNIQINDLAVSH